MSLNEDIIVQALENDCEQRMKAESEALLMIMPKLNDDGRRKALDAILKLAYCRGAKFGTVLADRQLFVQILDSVLGNEEQDNELN
jgi:hypothetical protein